MFAVGAEVFLKEKPSNAAIQNFLAAQAQSHFSYPDVGISARGFIPPGYTADHEKILLGRGEEVWQDAISAINHWKMFDMSWLQLCWPDAPILEGTNLGILIRHFGFWSLNAARIVYVFHEDTDSTKRCGLAYGTLLDHVESGEERFAVEWHRHDDSVLYDLFSFSQPRALVARFGYPLTRWFQHRFRTGSKAAMAKATTTTPDSKYP
jgi:uncharacterized protein (UPF0548 family)